MFSSSELTFSVFFWMCISQPPPFLFEWSLGVTGKITFMWPEFKPLNRPLQKCKVRLHTIDPCGPVRSGPFLAEANVGSSDIPNYNTFSIRNISTIKMMWIIKTKQDDTFSLMSQWGIYHITHIDKRNWFKK